MSDKSWTETLIPSLARPLRGRDWRRVDQLKNGGWIAQSVDAAGEPAEWYRVQEDRAAVSALCPFEDRRLKAFRELVAERVRCGEGVRLLAYRPESRAVVRVSGPGGRRILKIYRKDRALLPRWTALGSDAAAGLHVPEILRYDAERISLEIPWLPGESLHRRWVSGSGTPEDGAVVHRILGWIARQPIPDGFPRHGVAAEQRILGERLQQFRETTVLPPERTARVTEAVIARLDRCEAPGEVLCHRDFHDKQVLLEGAGASLIDLDLLAAGPPGLDRGNLIAHLRLRALQGAALPWADIAERLVEPVRGTAEGRDLPAWTAATLMRLALIYARRRRSAELLDALLDTAEEQLS